FLTLAGVARAVSAPARSSLLPQVVPPEALGNAVTWNSSGWQVANVAGPALGGLALGIAGGAAGPAYLLAITCSPSCVLLLMPVQPVVSADRSRPTRSLESLLAGARFVWRTELLLAAITLDLFAVLLGGATALLPIYAKDRLEVDEFGF